MKELLVPAGNMDCLYQAINNGCDAVYISLKKYGARKFANNFTEEEFLDAIKLCHLYDVKLYVTMNTLVKNNEVDDFLDSVRFLHKNGVDAIIMQDFGMICLVREMFPNLEIHASTQFNNSSRDVCELLYKLGVKRVIFSRELSIDEINNIDIPIEKEVFIHGALCISYSGCCLMSSMLGGRSGNRGECAGCCRMPFSLIYNGKKIRDNQYLLSTRELNTSSKIDELLKSNIYSFKIEGRMKSPLYVGFITKLYRNLIDGKSINYDEEINKLKIIYNREFTLGRLFEASDSDLINYKSPNHIGLRIGKCKVEKDKIKLILDGDFELNQFDAIRFLKSNKGMIINYLYDENKKLCSKAKKICYVDNKIDLHGEDILSKTQEVLLEKEFVNFDRKIDVIFSVKAKTGEKLQISITDGKNTITEYGLIVSSARNYPLEIDSIKEHLGKLGNTPFNASEIKVDMDDNIFIQIKEINEIRRSLVDKLKNKRENKEYEYKEEKVIFSNDVNDKSLKKEKVVCSVFREDQLKACIELGVDRIYVHDDNLYEKYKKLKNVYYYVERCQYNINDNLKTKNLCSEIFDYDTNNVYGNYSLNIFNIYTAYYLKKLGLKNIPISVELSNREVEEFIELYIDKFGKDIFEVLSYGKVENMIIKGNILDLNENDYSYVLNDNRGRNFNVYYDGVNTHIYNSELIKLNICDNNVVTRLDFYLEDYLAVKKICKHYLK